VPKVLRVPVEGLVAGAFALPAAAAHYVTRVHRLGPGASLSLFDPGQGLEAAAQILSVERGVQCLVRAPQAVAPLPWSVRVCQGVAKGEKLDAVVAEGTALGLTRLTPILTERSVTRFREPDLVRRRLERWRRVATEAARQCQRASLPELDAPMTFEEAFGTPFSRHLLFDWMPQAVPLLRALKQVVAPLDNVTFWIGPEGGFSSEERDWLLSNGATAVTLGPLVLRTELAAVSALAVWMAHQTELSQ
jgi:16S rRNA (uracil1498-N3)-methyltransferase